MSQRITKISQNFLEIEIPKKNTIFVNFVSGYVRYLDVYLVFNNMAVNMDRENTDSNNEGLQHTQNQILFHTHNFYVRGKMTQREQE